MYPASINKTSCFFLLINIIYNSCPDYRIKAHNNIVYITILHTHGIMYYGVLHKTPITKKSVRKKMLSVTQT
jgi:hypothetical protein